MEAKPVRRGEVWWAVLTPRSGSEQRGSRPVIVVSHDGFNLTPGWRSVVVVPLSTSQAQTRRGPAVVPVAAGAGGISRDSVALCHQITTLDRGKMMKRLGSLSHEDMNAVEYGLKAALNLI